MTETTLERTETITNVASIMDIEPLTLKGRVQSILAAFDIIRENGPDADIAKGLLGRVLEERDNDYFTVARAINDRIERVGDNLYRVSDNQGNNVYGSIITVLDVTPEVTAHAPLVHRIPLVLPKFAQSIAAEEVPPKPVVDESLVVVSGSLAQDRVVSSPTDIDLAEYIHIEANSPIILGNLLSQCIKRTVSEDSIIDNPNGQIQQLHFQNVRVGVYPPHASAKDKENKLVKWSQEELLKGQKDCIDENDQPYVIKLEEVCTNPTGLMFEYLAVTPDNQAIEVSKFIEIDAINDQGEVIVSTKNRGESAFKDIYFDDPTNFHLVDRVIKPETFIEHMTLMMDQINHIINTDRRGLITVSKRLYILLKSVGEVEKAQELAKVFNTDAAKIAQLDNRIRPTKRAVEQGLLGEGAVEKLYGQMRTIILKPENRRFASAKGQRRMDQDGDNLNRQLTKKVAMELLYHQVEEFLRNFYMDEDIPFRYLIAPLFNEEATNL